MFCSPVSAPRSRPFYKPCAAFFRNIGRLLRAALADALQIGLVGQQALALLADGPQQLHDGLADRLLEVAVAAPCKFRLDLGERPPGRGGVDGHQVRNALLVLGVIAHLGLTVRDGALEQTHDILRLIHQADAAGIVVLGLRHFGLGVGQTHDARADLGDIRLRQLEHVAVDAVEPLGDVARQLDVLLLVLAHRNKIRLIQQDIRRHQRGIGKQAAVDIVGIFCTFILELRHAAQLAEHGIAVEHPAEFCVLMHMALDEQHVLLRVQTAGDILRQLLHCAATQVCRVLPDGNGVKVRHKVIAIEFLCTVAPVPDRAEVGAERQVARRLDAGKHTLARRSSFRSLFCHKITPLSQKTELCPGHLILYILA